MSDPIESVEVERKYEVTVDAVLPHDFAAAGLRADPSETHRLEARYFDTAGGALAQQRVAVRRRRGGKDEGWHMKRKGDGGNRELLWPLTDEIPRSLRDEIARLTDQPILPLADLSTSRTVLRLRDASGAEVVEIADDRVLAVHHETGIRRAWREWEAELMPGADPAVLDAVEVELRGAGAEPSPNPAKIARASGLLRETDEADQAAARRLET